MTASITLPTLSEGFLVRAPTWDDLDGVAELLLLYEKAKYGAPESTVLSFE